MRRVVVWGTLFAACLLGGGVARADHRTAVDLRQQIETHAALLDSHTRRLYYEIREHAEGDDEQGQLLSDARELWRAARRLNDRALDGASATRLERDARRLEEAFHAVEEQFRELRDLRATVPGVHKRVQRIDGLVHQTHDGIHALLDREAPPQTTGAAPQRPQPGNYGYRTVEPLPRVQEAERRAADYVDPPAIRVGPDGFYFDGRRFTIPLGR
jgi:hypothetical protein